MELFGDDPCIFFLGGFGFSGLCDEFQFFNKALTAQEVAQAYENPQNLSSLTVWYDFNEVTPGTTGQFSNKVVDSAQSSTTAKYTKLGGGQTSSDGGYISQTSFTEYAPTLAEGRTITGSYTVTLPTEVQNGTLSVTNDETPLSAGENTVAWGLL